MKHQFIALKFLFFLFALIFTMTSCQKEIVHQPEPPTPKQLLTAKTWQVEEVTENYGTPNLIYKKGASDNQEDYSAVRQTYHNNGTVVYVDQDGNSGSDGFYELLDNNTKIRLGMSGPQSFSVIAENFSITAHRFSYRLMDTDTPGYIEFVFVPVQ